MSFSQNFIEKVRESSNIVDIIGQHTQLKRAGARLSGLCPFPDHNEKTPSFSVSEDRQLYHCFGCGKGGNVYTFLQNYRGMSFPESVEYLAERAGIAIEKTEPPKGSGGHYNQFQKNTADKKTFLRINSLAADYFHYILKKLPADHEHKRYMRERGLTDEMIDIFRIGISPKGWEGFVKVLEKRNAPVALAEKLGLVKQRNNKDGHFDLFRDRLMFPILSPMSEVLGFGGRTLNDDEPPKYLNSPETPVFNKGKTFYGLHETAKHIRTEDQVILVEGYMDLLALYSYGIKNVVAVLGTALTENHARLLKRYTKNVLVLFDGDSAGQKAAERSLSILLSQDLLPREVKLPEGQDPDDFLKAHGADELKKRFKQAPEFYTSFLDRCSKEFGTGAINKVKTIDRVGPILLQISDSRLRQLYFQETLDRLGVEEAWLKSALQKMKEKASQGFSAALTQQPSQKTNSSTSRVPSAQNQQGSVVHSTAGSSENPEAENALHQRVWRASTLPKAELQLLQVALKSLRNWQQVYESEFIEEMSEESRDIFHWLSGVYRQGPDQFDRLPALLASRVDAPNLVTVAISSTPTSENETDGGVANGNEERDEKLIQDCLGWIHGRYLRAKAKELALEMSGQPTPEQLEQFMNVQRRKRKMLASDKNDKTEDTGSSNE